MRTRTFAYQEVRNVSFPENFAVYQMDDTLANDNFTRCSNKLNLVNKLEPNFSFYTLF